MKTRIVALVICIFSATMLLAQPYQIKRLGIEQGISSNYVMSIAQDNRGFLWFATESGLNRFDGNGFKVYKKNGGGNKTISGNELNKVYADKFDNTIWIATQREGLNRFDCQTETFTFYKQNPDNPSGIITNDITDLTNASDGNLWISTYHKGVEYLDKETETFTHYNKATVPGWVSDNVWSVKEDTKGLLYIGHVSSGLSILSLKDRQVINFQHDPTHPESLPGNEVRTIYIDKMDNIWIGTNNGLALFNADKKTFTVFRHDPRHPESLIANSIYSIIQLNDGRLWIGSEMGGVSILDMHQSLFSSPKDIPFRNISYRNDESGFSNQTIRSIFQDSFDNIWFGTYGGGVNFISHYTPFFNTWEYSPLPDITNRLNDKTAWGICADNQNRLWVGTDGGGINLFVNGKRTSVFTKETRDLTDNAVLAAIKDSQDNLWFGTFNGGVNVYHSGKKTFSNLQLNNDSKEIRCFYEDEDKNMWIGSNEGLYVYNLLSGQTKIYTTQNSKLAENLVRSISKDKDGKIWIGFFGQGLSVFDAGFQLIESFTTEKGFPSNEVDYIYPDLKGQMWVGTGEGLVCFTATASSLNYRIFDAKNGLANSHIRAIAEDEQQNIWISTDGGISRYIPNQDKFYNYDHFNGIPVGNFMSGSVTQTADGMLFFGSQNGLCYFNPAQIPTELQLPATVITEFKIYHNQVGLPDDEISVPIAPVIQLAYNQNTFSVSFNVLNYSLNHLVEYAYMLSGLEKGWYNTQGENSITFRNIPPGTYELKIQSRIKNQEWSKDITAIQIVIHPPFWLTWWAKSIYVLLAIAAIFFIFRFYKRRLNVENALILEKKNHQQEQDLNNERLRFFTNITHELRTPLTLILGPLEDLSGDTSLPEKHADKISVIHKSATRLLNLINQILEFRKTETQNKKLCVSKSNLAELVQEVGMKYKELNTNKAIAFRILTETQNPLVYFDPDIITSIVDNLLSNAFKYTEKGAISLVLRDVKDQQLDYTEIEVQDTGRGIPAEFLPKIFNRYYQAEREFQASGTGIGLALVQNLVAIHQGEIFVDSQPGEGTSFRFRILTGSTYPDALHTDDESENKPDIPEEKARIELKETQQIVLVVEDNEDIRNYIADSLSDTYKVYSANNGKKGLEVAFAHIPDIIVSDVMMPEMDGFELCKILKEDVRTSHIPIILLTAKDTIQDRTEGYSLGVESYITKPFSAGLLQSRILNLLDARRKVAELINNNTANKNTIMIESLSKLDNEFMEQITAIVEQNLDSEQVDVEFIADKMCMSHSTLYRKIKALSGMSANEFIRKVRIRNAEQLLLTGKYTISEISYMVGINSITYFRQCFKEEFGAAPSEYIKQIKGDSK
jgi:ligand-binding sensor domain-containing protein/signal transduction histidine kinase/DNA-binding response OmpR family regulator